MGQTDLGRPRFASQERNASPSWSVSQLLVDRLADKGWTVDQMTDHINAWVDRTIRYVIYLTQEGCTSEQIVEIVHEAVAEADFDLRRMPVIPAS
jgi:hypothetical protein